MKPNTNVINGIVFRDKLKRITTLGLFDKMADHLRKQQAVCRQANPDRGCAFRNGDGTKKCAIGAIITDEVYASYKDDYSAGNVLESDGLYRHSNGPVREAVERSIRRPVTAFESQMLRNVQKIHDESEPMYWDALLTEQRGLLMREIKQARLAA